MYLSFRPEGVSRTFVISTGGRQPCTCHFDRRAPARSGEISGTTMIEMPRLRCASLGMTNRDGTALLRKAVEALLMLTFAKQLFDRLRTDGRGLSAD